MKQGPPQGPPTILTPSVEKKEEILSFEKFSFRDKLQKPRYDNFYLHFGVGVFAEAYRKQRYYKRFESEHSEIAKSLRKKTKEALEGSKNYGESLKPLDKEFYEAYKIMRSYGISDEDLFS